MLCVFILFAPETTHRPSPMMDDKLYNSLEAAWEKTKEAKDFHKWNAKTMVILKYWFYIMLAHGAIFFIMLVSY